MVLGWIHQIDRENPKVTIGNKNFSSFVYSNNNSRAEPVFPTGELASSERNIQVRCMLHYRKPADDRELAE